MVRVIALILAASAATPALAMSSIAVPEPGDLGLFALAVIGLIVGRQTSRRKPRDDGDNDDA